MVDKYLGFYEQFENLEQTFWKNIKGNHDS